MAGPLPPKRSGVGAVSKPKLTELVRSQRANPGSSSNPALSGSRFASLAAINEMETSETGHVAGEQIPMNCNAAVDECMLGDWYQSGFRIMSTRTGKSFRGRFTDYQRDELLLQLVEHE